MTQKNKHSVRVIPRLDIKGPNVVKGLQFDGNRVLGTPDVFAEIYYREGASSYRKATISITGWCCAFA